METFKISQRSRALFDKRYYLTTLFFQILFLQSSASDDKYPQVMANTPYFKELKELVIAFDLYSVTSKYLC